MRGGSDDAALAGGTRVDDAGVQAAVQSGGVQQRSCQLPHSHEVSAILDVATRFPSAYPGETALLAFGGPACEKAFRDYVAATDTTFESIAVVPTAAAWDAGVRRVACLIGLPGAGFFNGSPRSG